MKRITAALLISVVLFSFPLPTMAMGQPAPVSNLVTLSIFDTLADV